MGPWPHLDGRKQIKSRGLGNFGTGCRKHHTLPLVAERLRCSFWSAERGEEPGVSPTEMARALSGGTLTKLSGSTMLARALPKLGNAERAL